MSPTLTSIAMLISLVLAPTPTGVGAPPSAPESPIPLSPSDPSVVAPIPPAVATQADAEARPGPDLDAGFAEGHAFVFTKHVDDGRETHVVVLFDEALGSLPPDGRTDRMFVLQARGGSVDDLELRIPSASLEWGTGSVSIGGSGGGTLRLTIPDRQVSASSSDEVIAGFGLIHTAVGCGDLPLPNEVLTDAEYSEVFGSMDADPCPSGGTGAISCSVNCPNKTACSVGCGDGYMACCKCRTLKSPSCKCYKQ